MGMFFRMCWKITHKINHIIVALRIKLLSPLQALQGLVNMMFFVSQGVAGVALRY
jgi:hypothetical protein